MEHLGFFSQSLRSFLHTSQYFVLIKDIVMKYDQIKVVEGYKLVPHLSEYYLDNLHPNQLGAEIYGRNLVCEIEKLGF